MPELWWKWPHEVRVPECPYPWAESAARRPRNEQAIARLRDGAVADQPVEGGVAPGAYLLSRGHLDHTTAITAYR